MADSKSVLGNIQNGPGISWAEKQGISLANVSNIKRSWGNLKDRQLGISKKNKTYGKKLNPQVHNDNKRMGRGERESEREQRNPDANGSSWSNNLFLSKLIMEAKELGIYSTSLVWIVF